MSAQPLPGLLPIKFEIPDIFEVSETDNVARFVLNVIEKAAQSFRKKFGVDVELASDDLAKLHKIDALFQVGDFRADAELMNWADQEI